MKPVNELLKLYFVMGSINCKVDPRTVLREALEGGVTLFQFREKGKGSLKDQEKINLASDLQNICNEFKVPFLVNDDIDLAVTLNADGVHIGQEDDTVQEVRKKIGANKIIGVSVHTIEEAKKAIEDGADYLGVGPIYSTNTKTDTRSVQGPDGIKIMRDADINLPIVGIGGISESNANEVMAAGADGVAVVTAISHADSCKAAAEKLLAEVNR